MVAGKVLHANRYFEGVYVLYLCLMIPLLYVLFILSFYFLDDLTLAVVNTVSAVYFIAATVFVCYRLLRIDTDLVWNAIFWFPAQSAIFFGFGPLVGLYGNETTQLTLGMHITAATRAEVLRANLLSFTGIFFVVFGIYMHLLFNRKTWVRVFNVSLTKMPAPVFSIVTVCIGFIIVGGFIEHFIAKPTRWGQLSVVVPGSILILGNLIDVGLAFAVYQVKRGFKKYSVLLYTVWPVHIFLSILSFQKKELIIALLLPALGAFIATRNLKKFSLHLIVLAVIYTVSQGIFLDYRSEVKSRTGDPFTAGYSERLDVVSGGFLRQDGDDTASEGGQIQEWWLRLNYSGVQSYLMNAHDAGLTGSTFEDVFLYFIPRLIWPNKPVLDHPGRSLYVFITGREATSALGSSIYGDMYWNFGWIGVILLSIVVGYYYAVISWRAASVIKARNFIYFPVVLSALQLAAQGPTSTVAYHYIGSIPVFFVLWYGIGVAENFLRKQRFAQPPMARRV